MTTAESLRTTAVVFMHGYREDHPGEEGQMIGACVAHLCEQLGAHYIGATIASFQAFGEIDAENSPAYIDVAQTTAERFTLVDPEAGTTQNIAMRDFMALMLQSVPEGQEPLVSIDVVNSTPHALLILMSHQGQMPHAIHSTSAAKLAAACRGRSWPQEQQGRSLH